MSSRLPPLPDLTWKDGNVPRDQTNDDVYFSVNDGLEETREVFFRACGLPQRWEDRTSFTVAELGFGTGLNIIALRQLWRKHRPSQTARLHVVSFEGRLMSKQSAAQALSIWQELNEDVQSMLSVWPKRFRGVQRLDLGEGMTLTLHVDDILPAVQNAIFQADAWFLDGFSPAKNPDMWSDDVMNEIARLSAPHAHVGTFTVAGAVRRGLADVGFQVSKKPGFAKKRQRLEAIFPSEVKQSKTADPLFAHVKMSQHPKKVVIIGAGIMGSCIANALCKRGADVVVLDLNEDINAGASANPLGLVMPRVEAIDRPLSRACLEAYAYAQNFYRQFDEGVHLVDVDHSPKSDKEAEKFEKLAADAPLDDTMMQWSGYQQTIIYPDGVIVEPVKVRFELLSGMDVRWGCQVVSTLRRDDEWMVTYAKGEVTDSLECDLLIWAAGMGMPNNMKDSGVLPLSGRGGQIEYAECARDENLAHAQSHYVIGTNNKLVFGATFEKSEAMPDHSEAARSENLSALQSMDALIFDQVKKLELKSRTGLRATTPDKMPFVGWVPHLESYEKEWGQALQKGQPLNPMVSPYQEGLLIAGGLGARGLTWAPWLAEIAMAQVFSEPLPIERSVMEVLSPARFLYRKLKRANATD